MPFPREQRIFVVRRVMDKGGGMKLLSGLKEGTHAEAATAKGPREEENRGERPCVSSAFFLEDSHGVFEFWMDGQYLMVLKAKFCPGGKGQ